MTPAPRKIMLLAGARPNYMKIFPLWRTMVDAHPGLRPVVVHTGQHYDPVMSDIFFRDLGMPAPDHFLGVGSGSHAQQTARVMTAIEPVLEQERPDWLVVVGDVNSTVAGAMVAVKMGIPTAHVEAGLRSRDRTMPEEINRILTDSIADLLFTSCRDADENLLDEGVPQDRIHFVGNIMIDSLVRLLPQAERSTLLGSLGLEAGRYILVTLHRPSNVDDPERLGSLLGALADVGRAERPVVFPVHPRTRRALPSATPPSLRLMDPLGYIDFLHLLSKAGLVVTDSGGIQEETSYLGVPCITMRPNTERPVTITQGTNVLVPGDASELEHIVERVLAKPRGKAPVIEKWDGHTAERILAVLEERR